MGRRKAKVSDPVLVHSPRTLDRLVRDADRIDLAGDSF
jgi:hypothetical protein